MNPKSLRDHLNYLTRYGVVNKNDNLYSLTSYGKDVCELEFFLKPDELEALI